MNSLTIVFCIVAPLLLLGVFFWLRERERAAERREIVETGAAYHQAVTDLKANPTDVDLQNQARELGRRYAEMTNDLPERSEHSPE
jgi:hypothetical protein